jgi:hypothetical protein
VTHSRFHGISRPAGLGLPTRHNRTAWLLSLLAVAVSVLAFAGSAAAAEPGPGFTIGSYASPANFSAGDTTHCVGSNLNSALISPCDAYTVTVTGAGALPSDGSPITISDSLPAGLTVQKISLFLTRTQELDLGSLCTTVPLQCVFPFGALLPDEKLTMIVYVTVDPGTTGPLLNRASVSGGGAPTVRTPEGAGESNPVSSSLPAFGASQLGFFISGVDGRVDSQAGDHPYELTTTIGLRSGFRPAPDESGGQPSATSVQDVKDVLLDLPLGFVGSTLAAPQCTLAQLSSSQLCPEDTRVGEIRTFPFGRIDSILSPIWNIVPERGAPAEFGFRDGLKGAHIFYVHVVPTAHGYVLRSSALGIAQIALTRISVTFYGDPAAKQEEIATREGKIPSALPQVPFFTNPTSCSGEPLRAVAHIDSWQHPARVHANGEPDLTDPNWSEAVAESPPVTGCNALAFGPSLTAQPTTFQADTPSGLSFALKQPQTENVGTLATATLKKAVVKLPAGMTVNPSAADGLAACTTAQIGWVGPSHSSFDAEPQQCPEASKIGSLELTTPLISHQLTGAIYLAAQNENPFGATLAAYVVVDDPITGVLVKIAGQLFSDPQTGQLTASFDENPNLPFSELKLNFFAGPRAELATPESCGTFTTEAQLTPWSAPDSGLPATAFDSFPINSGCVGAFAPSFTALSSNVQAGAFTPFVASFSRSDSDQELGGLSLNLPPGLLAKISGVPLCSDSDASAGSCPQPTRVGTVTAAAGPGPNPLFVTGSAYLTGPYKGAPYGLSVVVPAVAGPFNFGNVVVRQALHIDPTDAHVTDVSDPFPTILKVQGANHETNGIPIKLRRVDVSIDRPGFTFNPTSCSKLQFSGSVSATQGATSPVNAPFQVTNCQALKFAPSFQVSTSGKTSKANGASLTAKLSYPNAPQGTYTNIQKVKVELPRQLPSRLTTLQKACTSAQFQSNPAGCPPASIIGHATVTTPLLPTPLTGPAYFVSHGGEAFPSLTIVLQGSGVTIQLVGTTFISKAGVTSTTFKTVPDTPFSTFELTLPQGKFSALASNVPQTNNTSFCGQKLMMPTEFVAQNGALIKQNTPVTATGCAKTKALTRKQKLAKAMSACNKKPKGKRPACRRQAHRRFGAARKK